MASGNLWALFKSVTEQPATLMATILARNGSTYDVEYIGGNISQVSYGGSNAFEIGSKVFVQDNKITGQAPELPFTEIEV